MHIRELLHPLESLRLRKCRAELRASVADLRGGSNLLLDEIESYNPYTRFARNRLHDQRRRLRKALNMMEKYVGSAEFQGCSARPLNRIRGDIAQLKAEFKDVRQQDQSWEQLANDLRNEMRQTQADSTSLEIGVLALSLSQLQREFGDALEWAKRYREHESVTSWMEKATKLKRTYAFEVARATRLIAELPVLRASFNALDFREIAADPQSTDTYRSTSKTLNLAEQKIRAGLFAEADRYISAIRVNTVRLQAVANRAERVTTEQIRIWSEYAAKNASFQQAFGSKIQKLTQETSAERAGEWLDVSQNIHNYAELRASTVWEDDRATASLLHPALDMPWPKSIGQTEEAAVSWQDLIEHADAVAIVTGRDWPLACFATRVSRSYPNRSGRR